MAQKYFTRTGETKFQASVETFEPVEAKTKATTALLQADNGNLACLLFIKSFHFEVALMQEHFNENYMDSDKFPKASFKGKLVDFSVEELSNKPKEHTLKGNLTVKGKSKEISVKVKVYKKGDKIIVKGDFKVKPEDFDIEIPGIVRKKIAKEILIEIDYELKKKE
jgi:hypothetical protein